MIIIPANTISGGYEVANSLRFDDGSSDYLTRTPASASNRKTWTYSTWIKSNVLTGAHRLFTSYDGSTATNQSTISWGGGLDYRLQLYNAPSGSPTINLITNRIFRDLSAWYHVVVAVDTTQATGSNRAKIYINGVQETSFSTELYGSQNEDFWINSNQLHTIGRRQDNSQYFDGYMSEVCFIDGQQLTPTSFGEFDEDTNIWKPIDVSGLTFGTNGFYLDFENSGSLGADVSGNGNNFTVNNLTSIDQTTDTCTNNFATLNPLIGVGGTTNVTLSEGNLKYTNTSVSLRRYVPSTIAIEPNSGKYYCEGVWTTSTQSSFDCFGIIDSQKAGNGTSGSATVSGIWAYERDGEGQFNGSTNSSYGATYTTNDVIGIAYNSDSGSLEFFKNNVSQGVADTGITNTVCFFISGFNSCVGSMEFGQTGFTHTPPTGYLALNTKNLSESL
jgi:hypothetical protein